MFEMKTECLNFEDNCLKFEDFFEFDTTFLWISTFDILIKNKLCILRFID